MNTIKSPTDDEAARIREVLGEALDLLIEDGADLSAIAQVFAAMAASGLCHAAGPQQAAQYLRELAEITAAQGHRYQVIMGGGEH